MATKTFSGVVLVFFVVASTECATHLRQTGARGESQESLVRLENVTYTSINNTVNYQSSTKFNSRGMGHLYLLTKMFLNHILKKDPYPPGFVRLTENETVKVDVENYDKFILHYSWVVSIILIGALMAAILPFIGLIFCCCRCAGKCGARSAPYDKKYDTCRRHFYAFLLSGVTVLIMFGVVCTFVTNEYVEEGAQALPKNARISLNDARLYINNTKREVNTLFKTNFNEIDDHLQLLLKNCGEIMQTDLKKMSSADLGANLSTILEHLRKIRKDLMNIQSLSVRLKEDYDGLIYRVSHFKSNLMNEVEKCKGEYSCRRSFTELVPKIGVNKKFEDLPNLSNSLQDLTQFLENINKEMESLEDKDFFKSVGDRIQSTVNGIIPDISRRISSAGVRLSDKADNITKILDKANDKLDYVSRRPLEEAEGFLRKYAHYRYYVGLGVSSVLLGILCCLGFGLLCGYCGKRPDHYSDDCCDKGTASRFLMMGVWLMFLTCSGLLVVALVYFVIGVAADRAVCQALYSPETSPTFAFVDHYADLSSFYENQPPRKLSKIITECHKNLSIYEVLGLQSQFNLINVNISAKVGEVIDSYKWDQNVELVSDKAKRNLRNLANSPVANSFNISEIIGQINKEMVRINSKEVIAAIKDRVMKFEGVDQSVKQDVLKALQVQEEYSTASEKIVENIKKIMEELQGNATLFKEHLRMGNQTTVKGAIEDLLGTIDNAQRSLRHNGKETLQKLAKRFGRELQMHVDSYVLRVQTHIYKDVGRCLPMSRVYNATVTATCNNILDPFNGFWLSVGCIVVLFIPALILSIKLSTLYQKFEPYPGALAESEYLYDMYVDRDNIPLANVSNNNQKKKKKKKVNRYESSVGYSSHLRNERGGRNGVAASAPAPQADERPWDFAQGGPPQYQSPPMSSEYERPPPYYFPGPNK